MHLDGFFEADTYRRNRSSAGCITPTVTRPERQPHVAYAHENQRQRCLLKSVGASPGQRTPLMRYFSTAYHRKLFGNRVVRTIQFATKSLIRPITNGTDDGVSIFLSPQLQISLLRSIGQ